MGGNLIKPDIAAASSTGDVLTLLKGAARASTARASTVEPSPAQLVGNV